MPHAAVVRARSSALTVATSLGIMMRPTSDRATTAGALKLALEIGRVTAGTSDITRRLEELWPQLRTVVPFEAAWTGVFDPGRQGYQTLTAVGHDAVNRAYLESGSF